MSSVNTSSDMSGLGGVEADDSMVVQFGDSEICDVSTTSNDSSLYGWRDLPAASVNHGTVSRDDDSVGTSGSTDLWIKNAGKRSISPESVQNYMELLDCLHVVPEDAHYGPGFKCLTVVEVPKWKCTHSLQIYCYQKQEGDLNKIRFDNKECDELCGEFLECGHICTQKCHQEMDPHKKDPRNYGQPIVFRCKAPCLKRCCRDHQCVGDCGSPCPPCAKCQQLVTSAGFSSTCDKILPICSHRCPLPTHDGDCGRCNAIIARYIDRCDHFSVTECYKYDTSVCYAFCKLNKDNEAKFDFGIFKSDRLE